MMGVCSWLPFLCGKKRPPLPAAAKTAVLQLLAARHAVLWADRPREATSAQVASTWLKQWLIAVPILPCARSSQGLERRSKGLGRRSS